MSKSQESFNKKEKEKKRLKKQQDKQLKKEERKSNSDKGKGLNEMMAYVDEFGNLTTVPPDQTKVKEEINLDDIQISTSKKEDYDGGEVEARSGVVSFFNETKGFGFIVDNNTKESIFVHVNGLESKVSEGDKVTFETIKGPKGLSAVNVKLIK